MPKVFQMIENGEIEPPELYKLGDIFKDTDLALLKGHIDFQKLLPIKPFNPKDFFNK